MTFVTTAIVGGSVAAAGIATKAISSGVASKKARKAKEKAERELDELEAQSPVYTPPSQYQKNIDLQTGIVKGYEPYTKTSELAGQALMESRIAGNTANAIANLGRTAGSQGQVTAGIGSALEAQNAAEAELGIKGAQNRMAYQELYGKATTGLQEANKDLANQEETAWVNNVLNKFNRKYQRQGALFTYNQQRQQQMRDQAVDAVAGGLTSIGTSMVSGGIGGMGGGTRTTKPPKTKKLDLTQAGSGGEVVPQSPQGFFSSPNFGGGVS